MEMQIQETLKSNSFSNEWHRLRVNILYSANWLSGEIKTFLEPHGITQKQFNILRILRGLHPDPDGQTINDLRDRMIDRMSDTSRLVERLEKKGLIRKQPCVKDRRHARVFIADPGLQLLADIDRKMASLDALTHGLSEKEAELLNNLLDKMRRKSVA